MLLVSHVSEAGDFRFGVTVSSGHSLHCLLHSSSPVKAYLSFSQLIGDEAYVHGPRAPVCYWR